MRFVPNGGCAAWSSESSALVVNGRSAIERTSRASLIPAATSLAR